MRLRLACSMAAYLLATPAHAALGESVKSVDADRQALKASVRVLADARFGAARYSAHEIQTPEGTLIREYVDLGGTVFAVTWQGSFMPNLRQTLGRYFETYQSVVRGVRKGRSGVSVVTPMLIVHSGGRLRAFSGIAYLPPAVPANVAIGELR